MPNIPAENLVVNVDIEGDHPDSGLAIQVSTATPLSPGPYTFQLRVEDNDGNESEPVTHQIVVLDDQRPNAIIRGDRRVAFGQEFTLDGSLSRDRQGRIVKYIWTLVERP